MLEAGVGTVRLIKRCIDGELSLPETKALIGGGCVVTELVRATRAVRQLIVLEQELTGQRPAPDRDAEPKQREARSDDGADRGEAAEGERLRDNLDDYDNGPLDQVIARMRKLLRVAAPADDPFAAPAERKPRQDLKPAAGGTSAAGAARAPSGSRPHHPFTLAPKPAAVSPGPTIRTSRRDLLSGVALTALGGAVRGRGPPR